MTWAEFKTAALAWTTVDAVRRGAPPENLRTAALVAGVRELQRLVPALRDGHTDTFTEGEVILNGECSQGVLPEGAKVSEARIKQTVSETACGDPIYQERPCGMRDWRDRHALISGAINGPYITISPQLDLFLFTPAAGGDLETELILHWSGIKTDYDDADSVRYGEHCAQVVGFYVKAEMVRQIDHDYEAYRSFMGDFRDHRADVFLDLRQNARADNLERAESR